MSQKKKWNCGSCGAPGHNKRGYPKRKSRDEVGAAKTVKKARASDGSARARSPEPSQGDIRKAQYHWKDKGLGDGVPDWLVCPLTQSIFTTPITANNGFTYDEDGIKEYILASRRDYPGQPILSPMRGENLMPGLMRKSHLPKA